MLFRAEGSGRIRNVDKLQVKAMLLMRLCACFKWLADLDYITDIDICGFKNISSGDTQNFDMDPFDLYFVM